MDIPETIKQVTEKSAEIESYHIEAMAAAYLNLTHLSPDKVRLVRKSEGSKLVWYFEEREPSRLEALEEVAKAAADHVTSFDGPLSSCNCTVCVLQRKLKALDALAKEEKQS